MSPAALALAVGLHGLVAAALWWASPARQLDHAETPILISIEPEPLSAGNAAAINPPLAAPVSPEPVQARPTPEPVQQAALAPAEPAPTEPAPNEPTPADATRIEPVPEPLPEPVPVEPAPAAPARQVTEPAAREISSVPPVPPPPGSAEPGPARLPTPVPLSGQVAEPAPTPVPVPAPAETAIAAPAPPAEAEAETAWQTDASSWKPQVTLEQSLAPPPPRAARPAPRPATSPRTTQTPAPRLQDYPPPTASLGGPASSSFDQTMGDGGARNDYLSRVYRHVDPHRDYPAAARAARQHGRVVTRVTINRAGELVDIRLDRSSGWPLLDNAEMAAIRRAMPLPPVPAGMPGDPVVLVLPMNY